MSDTLWTGCGVFVGDVAHPYCAVPRLVPLMRGGGMNYAAVKLIHEAKVENTACQPWIEAMRGQGIALVGWGVHNPGGDPAREAADVRTAVQLYGLAGYIADLEEGFFYDGDTHGWGDAHGDDEQAAYKPAIAVLGALRVELGPAFPLAVTCLVRKDYPYAAFEAAGVDLMPQLYGARDALSDAQEALGDFHQRAAAAEIGSQRIRPALWKSQANPGPTAGWIRFVADAMDDGDFR